MYSQMPQYALRVCFEIRGRVRRYGWQIVAFIMPKLPN